MDGLKQSSDRPVDVVFGSGGTHVLLGGAGALLAFHVGRIDRWRTVGAASGGTFAAAIMAKRLPPKLFLPVMIDTNFAELLAPRRSLLWRLWALARKFRYEKTRPRRGVYTVEGLSRIIDKLVPAWPQGLWIVATGDNNSQILFTCRGVFRYVGGKMVEKLADAPPPVGVAVAASCAIPGILDSTQFNNEWLFDGALSGDGDVPVDVIDRHFGAREDSTTLAIDVGEHSLKRHRWLRLLWHICAHGWADIDSVRPTPRPGLVVITPKIEGFHPLQFDISRAQKWRALVSGFVATAEALCKHNLTDAGNQERLRRFIAQFEFLSCSGDDCYSKQIEAFLTTEGLL